MQVVRQRQTPLCWDFQPEYWELNTESCPSTWNSLVKTKQPVKDTFLTSVFEALLNQPHTCRLCTLCEFKHDKAGLFRQLSWWIERVLDFPLFSITPAFPGFWRILAQTRRILRMKENFPPKQSFGAKNAMSSNLLPNSFCFESLKKPWESALNRLCTQRTDVSADTVLSHKDLKSPCTCTPNRYMLPTAENLCTRIQYLSQFTHRISQDLQVTWVPVGLVGTLQDSATKRTSQNPKMLTKNDKERVISHWCAGTCFFRQHQPFNPAPSINGSTWNDATIVRL